MQVVFKILTVQNKAIHGNVFAMIIKQVTDRDGAESRINAYAYVYMHVLFLTCGYKKMESALHIHIQLSKRHTLT